MRYLLLIWLFPLLLIVTFSANTEVEEAVSYRLVLLNISDELDIGEVTLYKLGDDWNYKLYLDHSKFKDFFLSMKEMKCLEGPELWCHIPYPYPHSNRLKPSDWRWLEHDLLFMFKPSNEFGANFWNGIYYKFELNKATPTATAHYVDLNPLAATPDDLSQPLISELDLTSIDNGKRWWPRLTLRKTESRSGK